MVARYTGKSLLRAYLFEWREKMGKKPVDAAKALGVTATNISRWEGGTRRPSVEVVRDYANWLGLPMQWLYKKPPKLPIARLEQMRKHMEWLQ